jgi:hypothetical protein
VHGWDTHTIVDIVTLLLAIGSGIGSTYRRLSARLELMEKTTATHDGALKAAGLL